MNTIKDFTVRLLKSAVIYGAALVCTFQIINCASCTRPCSESCQGSTVVSDTDSLAKPLQPDSTVKPIDPVEDSCLE